MGVLQHEDPRTGGPPAGHRGPRAGRHDFRLAPEHPYPQGLEDCLAAWPAFAAVFPGRRLAMAGDSAGANLAVATMLRLQAQVAPAPDVGLLFYGVYDDDFESPSYRQHAEGPGLTRAKMRRY